MKTMTTTAPRQYSLPMSRSYPANGRSRNASITISKLPGDDHMWGEFQMTVSYQNWTGGTWLEVFQRDEFFTVEAAIEAAKEIANYFKG